MSLTELPELHEKRSDEGETFQLVNMLRRRTNAALGEPSALAITTTAGFATAPVVHGAPVGVPDPVQGDRIPWVVDDVDMRVWFYVLGGWHYAQLV